MDKQFIMPSPTEIPISFETGQTSGEKIKDELCEKIVIGSLLRSKSEWYNNSDLLTDELFTNPTCNQAFRAAKSCLDRGETPDVVNVIAEAQKSPKHYERLNESGVKALMDEAIPTTELREKIKRLLELKQYRKIISIGDSLRYASLDKPLSSIVGRAISALSDIFKTASSDIMSMKEVWPSFRKDVLEGNRNGTHDVCIPTGFKMLDDKGALQLSDMWVIAADSSQGKTSFAAAVALHATKSGVPTAFYSMEMTANQLFARIMATRIGVPNEIITKRPLTDEQYQRAIIEGDRLEGYPIYFDEKSTSSLDEILSSIRTMHYKKGVKLVVVDYMQILNVNTKSANEEQALANAARKFKNIAKELNICVIILSQLSRDRNDSRPKLARLRGSGQITEAADGVILIWRPEYYGSHLNYPQPFADVSTHNTALIEVAKGRNVGCTSFIAGFEPKLTKFKDLRQDQLPKRKDEQKQPDDDEPF